MSEEMITDRTATDTTSAIKIREDKIKKFLSLTESDIRILERGFFTKTAINRIENKQREIKEMLQDEGYTVNIQNKTWQDGEFFENKDFERLVENDIILSQNYASFPDMPTISKDKRNYENINALEKILVVTQTAFETEKAAYIYCGTHYTGQEGII